MNFIDKVKSFLNSFGTKPTGRIINAWEHTGWGNRIYPSDWENRRWTGWLTNKPVVGDEIRIEMKKGGIARLLVVEVEYCGNPRDMFFCTTKDLGYEKK